MANDSEKTIDQIVEDNLKKPGFINRETVHKQVGELNRNTIFMADQLRRLAYVSGILDAGAFVYGIAQEVGTDKQVTWPRQPAQVLDVYTLRYLAQELQLVAHGQSEGIVIVEMVDATPDGEERPKDAVIN